MASRACAGTKRGPSRGVKLAVVVGVLVARSLDAGADEPQDPRVSVEAGLTIAKSTGSPAPTAFAPLVTVGVRIARYLTIVASYRDLLTYTVYPLPAGINDAPITFHYRDVVAAVRYAWPATRNVFLFGETRLVLGYTTISDTDFAGGDDESQFHVGAGIRIGVIGQLPWAPIGAGVAISYDYFGSSDTSQQFSIDRPILGSWRTLDIFARVAF